MHKAIRLLNLNGKFCNGGANVGWTSVLVQYQRFVSSSTVNIDGCLAYFDPEKNIIYSYVNQLFSADPAMCSNSNFVLVL